MACSSLGGSHKGLGELVLGSILADIYAKINEEPYIGVTACLMHGNIVHKGRFSRMSMLLQWYALAAC